VAWSIRAAQVGHLGGDIFFGVLMCGRRLRREKLEAGVLRLCTLEEEGLVCFTVRSGWDLWLRAQGLRSGDEVLVSAITHPDMIHIIHEHGLRAVPADIDPGTLAVWPWMLEAALTPRTRVVLVAHLFGGLMVAHLLHLYGTETGKLLEYSKVHDNAFERLTPGAPDLWAQVYHAIGEEWAMSAEDIIYRRTTLGLRGFDTPEFRQRISAVLEAGAKIPPAGLFEPISRKSTHLSVS
jgi:hypothetical protein